MPRGSDRLKKIQRWATALMQRIAGNPTAWAVWYAERDGKLQARANELLNRADHCRRRAKQWAAKAKREGY